MRDSLVTIAYIAAGVLFILSLGGLAHQETARRGNSLGIAGMIIALAATAARMDVGGYGILAVALVPGAAIGALLAWRVKMTAMRRRGDPPQLVGLRPRSSDRHLLRPPRANEARERRSRGRDLPRGLLGSVTSPSLVAFGSSRKHPGRRSSFPAGIGQPGELIVTIGPASGSSDTPNRRARPLLAATALTGLLGATCPRLGGADMPRGPRATATPGGRRRPRLHAGQRLLIIPGPSSEQRRDLST